MKTVRLVLAVLLTIALFGGCGWLLWFSGNSWRAVARYDRYTLGNYHEVLARALLLSVPAGVMIAFHAATCAAIVLGTKKERIDKLRRVNSWSLFSFAALLVAIAIWFTITSRCEGAGYIVFLTGPMVAFALVVPTTLGFLFAPRSEKQG
jgi:cytochrome bd-type quinol oxidase subunit 2